MAMNNLSKILFGVSLIIVIVLSSLVWLLNTQVNDLKTQKYALEKQVASLQNQTSEALTQNEILQNQTTLLQDKVAALQNLTRELENQNNKLINQFNSTPSVKITDFRWIGGFNPIVGLTLGNTVKVTVFNENDYTVSGLNLTYSSINSTGGDWNQTITVGLLNGGESREISYLFLYILGAQFQGVRVTLHFGEHVLDTYDYLFQT